jgi:hypothetical protein
MRGWSLYQISAIESWDGALELDAYFRALRDPWPATLDAEYIAMRFQSAARTVADFTEWDGDGFWMVSGLPDCVAGAVFLVFMVKQRRDDLTFVAAELEMPWLEKCRCPKRTEPRRTPQKREVAVNAHIERAHLLAAEMAKERQMAR